MRSMPKNIRVDHMKQDFKKNEHYIIDITDIGVNGEGIGKVDGFTFFVDGTLPGEKAEIIATKIKKGYGYGRLVNIIAASPDRIEPMCPVAGKCGGCSLQHLSYPAQLVYKTEKVRQNLARIGGFCDIGVSPAIGTHQPFRYRNKAQYPVAFADNGIVYGFYANHSHRVVPCEDCAINSAENKPILEAIKAFAVKYGLDVYDEEKHCGLLRHIVIKNGFHTGETMVCLVINSDSFEYEKELAAALSGFESVKSIYLSFNTKNTNVIMGDKNKLISGKDTITDTIGELRFNISPLSFFQVNPIQTEKLYSTVLEFADLNGSETVIDAYCGIGTISLFLAKRAKKVYGVEIVSEAVDAARQNALLNKVENAEFFAGRAEDIVPMLYEKNAVRADVVVVDPPRKGCDESLLKLIEDMLPQKVVYVSCDSATLARDLKILCSKSYSIKRVQPVDMFPQTVHVECVVLMSRTSCI